MIPTTREKPTPPDIAAPPVDEETRARLGDRHADAAARCPRRWRRYERFEAIFGGTQAPFAFLDLDAVWANAADMLRRSRGKPIRIASRSIRSRPVLERLLDLDPGFQGALTYTPARDPLALGARACATSSSPTPRPTGPA